MNRKECYEFIKTHKELKDSFTKKGLNMTRTSTDVLINEIEAYKKANAPKKVNTPKKACVKAVKPCKKVVSKYTDEGARKAILAIAKILNLKNIEKNFN